MRQGGISDAFLAFINFMLAELDSRAVRLYQKSDFFKKYDFFLWELAIGGKLGYFNSRHIHANALSSLC